MKFTILEDKIKRPFKHNKNPEDFNITNYKINTDGSLNVLNSVILDNKKMKRIPFYFNKVMGDFNCYNNGLTSLYGAPNYISGDFLCSHNNLTDLKYSPKIVRGYFFSSNNNLKTLNDLNFDGIEGNIYVKNNLNLVLSDKVEMWNDLNPGRLFL